MLSARSLTISSLVVAIAALIAASVRTQSKAVQVSSMASGPNCHLLNTDVNTVSYRRCKLTRFSAGIVNSPPGSNRDVTVCCVGGTIQGPYLSTCKGWPICSGSATTTVTTKPLSCATIITWTSGDDNSEYYSLVSKLSESLDASGTHYQTTIGVTGGAAASSAGPSATESASAGVSASSTSSASATQSTSSNGSGAVMAQLVLVAGGVLGLAVML